MRGIDWRDLRGRLLAWILLASAALASGAGDPAPPETLSNANEPIQIAADRVQYWDLDDERWVVLEGHAAILVGVEGDRSERAVVRIRADELDGAEGHQLDVFAEGKAPDPTRRGRPVAAVRRRLFTSKKVEMRAFQPFGMSPGKGDLFRLPIVARAFPEAVRESKAAIASAPAPDSTRASPRRDPDVVPASLEVVTTPVADVPIEEAPKADRPKVDPQVQRAQLPGEGFPEDPGPPVVDDPFPAVVPNPAGAEPPAVEDVLPREGFPEADPPQVILPEPGAAPDAVPPSELPAPAARPVAPPSGPMTALSPESVLVWGITPRDGGPQGLDIQSQESPDGTITITATGGVIITVDDRGTPDKPGKGMVDISCDSAVIWTRRDAKKAGMARDAEGRNVQSAREPLEAYLEGNVIIRNDERKLAGHADEKTFKAPKAYFDFRTQRLVALNAEVNLFAPGLITPMTIRSPLINQYRPLLAGPNGSALLGRAVIHIDEAVSTGSRFPHPGYRFRSRSIDLYQLGGPEQEPASVVPVGPIREPDTVGKSVYRVDARANTFFIGPVPFFYWPRFQTDSDDLDPPLRSIQAGYVQYFGYELFTNFNGFKLLGIKKPAYFDRWNLDIDYLQNRGPALGSELGWFSTKPKIMPGPFNGYLEAYGILDSRGVDTLGPGPAIITDGPPGAGKKKYQRTDNPFYNQARGRLLARHTQSFLDAATARDDEDFYLRLEGSFLSDRNFLEQYYKRLFDAGLDQGTDAYLVRQRENRAFTVLGSVNIQDWYTDTQYLPKLEYYRLGDSLLGHRINYSTDSGIDYANVHTATEVNNKNINGYIPYDPVSNTSGPFQSGRAWTSHEIDVPINLDVLRLVPYAQGQLTAWDNQLDGNALGRAWGAVGMRANVMAWRSFKGVDSDLLNIHDLSHKVNFNADARFAYSNVNLNTIGIQDTLDDNTYEWARRYFALTNYVGGVLPPQYDPRFLTLRRAISPIAGTTDVQGTVDTVKLSINQRLQTRRGPVGRQRVIDWMTLDLSTTYFPNSSRDNFGKPFGQNMYNYEWFLGDRTSIVSTGWFEFFDVTGRPMLVANPTHNNNPFAFGVINTGINIARPPRGNIYLGYSVINTGPIATSALNTSFSYLLSPKWYGSFSTVYDFGNAILLSASASMTRIGADWLTSVGLSLDPQRGATQFSFELTPRLSPNIRFGSTGGMGRFDPRFAPTQ